MRGLTILWDGFSLDIQLLASYANKTCGLCGNFNGSPKDDFIVNANGDVAATPDEFGRQWKKLEYGEKCSDRNDLFSGTFVNRYSSINDMINVADEANDDSTTDDQRIKICQEFLNNPDFKTCRTSISVKQYYNICLRDCDSGLANCSCNTYQQFAQACSALNNADSDRWIPKRCSRSLFKTLLS